jgi:hypothetical protein
MRATNDILDLVTDTLDALVAAGTPYGGLFPSLLDRRSGTMLEALPPPIAGQRLGDRAHPGSNLIHDQAALATLYGLGSGLGRDDYRRAADTYLRHWATTCTDTATGLFPWGEHSFWHLTEQRVGNSYALRDPDTGRLPTHDHLRLAPLWLWDKLWEYNPRCVERFAEGLDFHWKEGEPAEYNRHANITVPARTPRTQRASDFPRHGGFFILDWAVAHVRTGRRDFLEQIRRLMDHWWSKRDGCGLLLTQSRTEQEIAGGRGQKAPGQTISHAASLYEAAAVLEAHEPGLAATMRERAAVYVEGFLSAPHDLARRVFMLRVEMGTRDGWEPMPIWGSAYGRWPASYVGLTALCTHRLTGDPRLLAWAMAVGEGYATQPFPAGVQVPAMDAGLGLGLLADLFDVTQNQRWLDAGLALARKVVPLYWDDAAGGPAARRARPPLPRGAAGIDWYESQMGPSFLVHGLARLALLEATPGGCPLGADYTAR